MAWPASNEPDWSHTGAEPQWMTTSRNLSTPMTAEWSSSELPMISPAVEQPAMIDWGNAART